MKAALLKTSLLSALLLSFSAPALAADSYNLDPAHSNILWHASHFGFSSPSGHFGIKTGKIMLDEAKPENSSVEVTIDTTSLVTGVEKFDKHLKSADFLDSEKFPTATFKSTKVAMTGKDTADVQGDFTLHGVTKPVVLKVKLNKIGEHPMTQKKAAGFTASTVIKRSEFGIDKYVPKVSDEVRIDIEAEAGVLQ